MLLPSFHHEGTMADPKTPSITVSPSELGLDYKQIEWLQAGDARPHGDGNGIPSPAEYDDFVQTTMRSPSQILPTEAWLGQTLKLLDRAGIGINLRATLPYGAYREVYAAKTREAAKFLSEHIADI